MVRAELPFSLPFCFVCSSWGDLCSVVLFPSLLAIRSGVERRAKRKALPGLSSINSNEFIKKTKIPIDYVRLKDETSRMSEKPFPQFFAFEMSRLFVSQEQMSLLCGVSPITVFRWLHGRRKPSFLEEYALRRFLPSLGAGCAEILIARNASVPARASLAGREPAKRSAETERSAIVERSEVPPERPAGEAPPEEPKPAPRVAPFPPAPRPPIQPGYYKTKP
jgi:hypothetical protein